MSRTRGSTRRSDLGLPPPAGGVVAEAGADERLLERRWPSSRAAGVPSRTSPAPATPIHVMPSTGRVHDADERLVGRPGGEPRGDRDGPERHAVQVVDGAVERIDDPLDPGRRRACRALLGQQPVAGAQLGRAAATISASDALSMAVTTSVGDDFVAATDDVRAPVGEQRARPRGRSAELPRGAPRDRSPLEQRAQHVRQDPAVPEVLGLARGVDAHHRVEALVAGLHLDGLPSRPRPRPARGS